ncbi:Ribonuclease H-like protein [Dioscorea alata]|uniref:Ribonuclease H-like protein n=1 Tax=Dioscorea alata TaxID=55571 RepID=A0ACB7UL53_DIOAL|nr:Ribonuclease H-like protein [Dioscorea alata]
MENNECQNEISSQIELDLYDLRNWKNANSNLRDLIVDKGPIRDIAINNGCNDWKYLSARLKQHETSNEHIIHMTAWIELERKRTLQKCIIENYCCCENSRNNLAFRGSNEKNYEDKFDLMMQEHVRRIQANEIHDHYLGHKIQNEMIDLLSNEIKMTIVNEIRQAKYFSVILDCTSDVSNQEQMSLILRCVDVSSVPIKIEEYFIEFLKVYDTTGKGIFEELMNIMKKLDLNIDDIRGQGYDNGSNLKGKHQAFYTPCGCIHLIYYFLICLTTCIKSVKAISFQAPEIRDALLELGKFSNNPKTNSETNCLAIYELENFEFLENDTNEVIHLLEDDFRINYFIRSRFEQFKIYEDVFGFLHDLQKILLTIPITIALAEKSFLKLKLIKSFLRSTMSQERLNGLPIISTKIILYHN